MEPFLGEIQMFAFNFAPQGWLFCQGQQMPINQNQALFALLGTTYGGNGMTTFALPDLRGRSMVHFGTINLGEVGGTPTVTLLTQNMPTHTHAISVAVNTAAGTTDMVTDRLAANPNAFKDSAESGKLLNGVTVGSIGQSSPFSIRNPYLGINHCIARSGVFPSRS
jgi:microcystin-dependent protein